ncbi:MAG TPA: glycosyltransferase [Flavisolibacter sp.]|nr:glycosyltransferase [Flavisolibacter sp.]
MTKTSSIRPGMKVLFATFPADGHFNPLTGLAKHLQGMGCDVRWYTSNAYLPKLQKLDIPHFPLNRALDITGDKIDLIFADREKCKSQVSKLNFDFINLFILRGAEYFEDLKEIHQSFAFDLMVADMAFAAIPMVKEKMNIPVITIGICPLMETSVDLPPAGLGMLPNYSFIGKKKQSLLRFISDKFLFKKSYLAMKDMLANYGIQPDGNLFNTILRKSSLVLQSGTPGFEYFRSDLGNNIKFIGPLLPYTTKQKTDVWYDERLSRYSKVILVTQGTVEKDVNKIIIPTLEAFKNSDCLVIVTTGGSKTQELQIKYGQENIIIADFIPFEDILPYTDVYITNGGYGGVMLGIQNQVPMIVAGVHEGKNEICARVGYFKIGINLKTETPVPTQVRNAAEEILSNHVYKKNVTRLSKEFSNYSPNELFVEHVNKLLEKKTLSEATLSKKVAEALELA